MGDLGSIPGLGKSPGGGHGNLLQYPCLKNPQGQRSLAGYTVHGVTELDTIEQLSTAQHRAKGKDKTIKTADRFAYIKQHKTHA